MTAFELGTEQLQELFDKILDYLGIFHAHLFCCENTSKNQ